MSLYIFNSAEELQIVIDQTAASADKKIMYYDEPIHTTDIEDLNIFKFNTPADHEDSQYIKAGNLAGFFDTDGDFQLFEIKEVEEDHGDSGIIKTAFCEHVFYEILDEIIEDLRPQNCSAAFALGQALSGSDWQAGTVDDLGLNSTNFYYESRKSALIKIRKAWGGEIKPRLVLTGGVITARYIDLKARLGSDTGKIFTYDKDVQTMSRRIDSSNIFTAAYGRGKGVEVGETATGTSYGRRLTFGDVIWTTPTNPANKPAGQEWIGDAAALATWGRRGRHRMGIFKDEEETDPVKLLEKTWDFIQLNKDPKVSYTMKVSELERLTGYNHEAVRLGDGIRSIDRLYTPVLYIEARIIKIERHLTDPTKTVIDLGNFVDDIASVINDQEQAISDYQDRRGVYDQFTPGVIPTDWLQGQIDALTNQINAGGGTVIMNEGDGLIVVDNKDNPTTAIRLIGGALSIASNKNPDGSWNWRSFGTGNGFTADEIKTGTITGGKITFDLVNGVLTIKDAAGAFNMAQFNASQIIFGKNAGQQFIVNADGSIVAPDLTIGVGEQGGFLFNPRFSKWASGNYPDGSAAWTAGGGSKQIVDGKNVVQFDCAVSGTQYGMTLSTGAFAKGVNLDGLKYFCLEIRFRLTSGTSASGAAFLVDVYRTDGTYQRLQLNCSDAGATLTTNTWYTLRKIYEITDANIAKTFSSLSGYLLANWSSAGNAVKTIQFAAINMYTATRQDFLTQTWTINNTEINGASIRTGTLSFDKAYGGTLQLGGSSVNANGALKMLDSAGVAFGSVDKDGILMAKPLQVSNTWTWNVAGYGQITGTQTGLYGSALVRLLDNYPNPGGEWWRKEFSYDLDDGGIYMEQSHNGGMTTDWVNHKCYIGADPIVGSTDRENGKTHFKHGNAGLRIMPYDTAAGYANVVLQGRAPEITLRMNDVSENAEGSQGKITFFGYDGAQSVQLRFNDYDSTRAPFGLHIEKGASNTQPTNKAYLAVEGNIYSNNLQVAVNPDICRAYNSTNISIAFNAWTNVPMNSEYIDNNTMHDNVTNNSRITIKKSGVYEVNACINFDSNANGPRGLMIIKNAGTIIGNMIVPPTSGSNTVVQTSIIDNFVAGDYIYMQAYQNCGYALNLVATAGAPTLSVKQVN